MLNMSSVTTAASGQTTPSGDDRTARARIRDAAIERFAANGVDGTSVRDIAATAGVSPALVIHHFGSKDNLRVACDEHVASLIRERKTQAAAQGPSLDVMAALRTAHDGPPLLPYLARTLMDGSPHVAELVDELVADAETYLELGEQAGMLRPSDDRRGRAIVLTIWSLGALALRDHLSRLLGVDITGDTSQQVVYAAPAMDILGQGVFSPEAYEQIVAGIRAAQEERP